MSRDRREAVARDNRSHSKVTEVCVTFRRRRAGAARVKEAIIGGKGRVRDVYRGVRGV